MKKKDIILAAFIIAKLIMQFFLIAPVYELHRDEFLHLDQAGHLAWGYLSVPPLTSWISCIILFLGNNEFWIKFFPALFGSLTIVVVWKIAEALKGGLFASVMASMAAMFSVIARINILYQPNSADILLWTVLFYLLIRYINTYQEKWLYRMAITIAVGVLNKYNIVFLLVGMLPAVILSEQRKLFLNKHFYFSITLALVLILPNLLWQFKNDFPVMHHLNALSETQLVNVSRADFLKEQFLFFIGSIFLIVTAILSLLANRNLLKYRIILFTFLFTLTIFILLRAKGYYAIGLYPVLLAIGAVQIERLMGVERRIVLKLFLVAVPLILFIPLLKYAFPIRSPEAIQADIEKYRALGLVRWEDGNDHHLPQDFADMLGWKELASIVDSIYIETKKDNTLVLCDNYGEAGAINYYTFHSDVRAVSFSADYINWFPLNKNIECLILVKDVSDDDTLRSRERKLFENVQLKGKIRNAFARELGTSVYLLTGPKTNINVVLQEEIVSRKQAD